MKKLLLSVVALLMVLSGTAQNTRNIGSHRIDASRLKKATTTTTTTSTSAATATTDQARRRAINDYLMKTMARMDNGASLTRNIHQDSAPKYIIKASEVYFLKETPHNADPNKPENGHFIENNTKLYPGALVVANKKLADGDPVVLDQGITGVGKVDVMLDIDTGGQTHSITTDNTPSAINTAVRELVRQMYSSNYRQPGRSSSATGDYYSTEQFALEAGLDVNFAAKFKACMSTNSTSSTVSHVDDLSQVYYNVIVVPHDNDYSNLFGPNTTVKDLESIVASYNAPLAFINQMSYGCRLYVFYEFHESEFDLNASASGSYSGVSANVSTNMFKKEKSSSRKVHVYGGNPEFHKDLIQDEATIAKILKEANEPMTMSKISQGLPMSYMTTFIGSKQTCNRFTEGYYKTYDYERCVDHLAICFRNNCSHTAGAILKVRLDYKCFYIDKNGEKKYLDPQDGCYAGYQRWTEAQPGWGDKSEYSLGPWPIETDPRYSSKAMPKTKYYIEGPLHYQLRYKYAGGSYGTKTGQINWRNGKIDIKVNGSVRPGGTTPYIHSSSYSFPDIF